MENDNDSEFEIIANKSFYIDHEPTIKEKKKKKKEPISNDTINKPTRKTKEKKLS